MERVLNKIINQYKTKPSTQRGGTVSILTNQLKTVLYTGVTSNLISRVQEHKSKKYPHSFTSKYNVVHLVWFCPFSIIEEAINEEKRIKGGNRAQKCALINAMNSNWEDLWEKEVSKW